MSKKSLIVTSLCVVILFVVGSLNNVTSLGFNLDNLTGCNNLISITDIPSSALFYYGVNTDALWKETHHQGTVLLGDAPGTNVLMGSTWISENEYPWWVTEYQTEPKGSSIWKINTDGDYEQVTVDCSAILSGLEFDPCTEQLYGCNVDKLYAINMVTGAATLVGSMPGHHFIDMGISREGQGYGIDIITDSLYKINLSNASTELIGPLGIDEFLDVSSCSFDHGSEYDDFFLVIDDGSWSLIYYCNINTGECFLLTLLDTQLVTALAISYGNQYPTADFTWTPLHPQLGETILFNASTSQDSDGYLDLYEWDWDNDGKFDESSSTPLATHTWSHGWKLPVTVRVWDDLDGSSTMTKILTVYGNRPPQTPFIMGPKKGIKGVSTAYNFTTIDQNDDWVYYFIDWGDQTNTSWIGPYDSGDVITISHTWFEKGTYLIQAKAKDTNGNESDWKTLTITMPCSYNLRFHQFWGKLFERSPNAISILRYLLWYS